MTKGTGEVYTYRFLWASAKHQYKLAKHHKQGRAYCCLSSMIMAYFTYESYLNFLGEFIAPEIWKEERVFFNSPEHKGTNGKLKKILEIINKPIFNKGERPYQTIKFLNTYRNSITHGKQEHFVFSAKHGHNSEPDMLNSDIMNSASLKNAERVLEDIQNMIEILHNNSKPFISDKKFPTKAISGVTAVAVGWSSR